DIGDDAEIGKFLLQATDRGGHQAFGVVRLFGQKTFFAAAHHGEQSDRWDAERHAFFRCEEKLLDTLPFDARHGSDLFLTFAVFEHEHRINKIVRAYLRFSAETARKIVHPEAAHAGLGKT